MFFTKYVRKLLSESKKFYIIIFVSTMAATLLKLLVPQIIGYTFDSIFGDSKFTLPFGLTKLIDDFGGRDAMIANIWIIGALIIFISVLSGLFSYIGGYYTGVSAEDLGLKIREKLYYHLQNLPYVEYGNMKTGDIIQRCTSDVETIRLFLANQLVEIFRILFVAVVVFVFMLRIDVALALISIGILPISLLFSIYYLKQISTKFQDVEETEGALSSAIQENVSGVRVVKAFGMQKYELEKFNILNEEMSVKGIKLGDLYASYWSISDTICIFQFAILTFVGAYFGYIGKIDLGEYMVFMAFAGNIIWPIRQLGRIFSGFSKAKVSITRINEIIIMPLEKEDEDSLFPSLKGDIVFNDVSFSYKNDKNIIDNVSFKVKQGETVGIIGTTGSGKSTLMHLLLRLFSYDKGNITINDVELNKINKKHLRKNIGIVLQDNFLYAKSIIENLRMSDSSASDEEIFACTKTASIHDTILSFDKGYNTLVGEKGVTLSGGQKQRTTIARTLIKNSDILIFDDSLSAVDTETDAKIRNGLKQRNTNATTFIISQRITTLMECDKIMVFNHGKIENIGTHKELIMAEGLYKEIWNIQNLNLSVE